MRIVEGVTQPGLHHGYAAAPQGGVHHRVLHLEGEGAPSHTALYPQTLPHYNTEATDELPGRNVGRVLPAIVGAVRAK